MAAEPFTIGKVFCGTRNKIFVLASEVKILDSKISAENVE
jgi:hypothetical protein